MPLDLPLRCRCGRMRGVASDVSPVERLPLRLLLQGLPGIRAFPRAGGRARPGRRNGHLPDAARPGEARRRHGCHALPAPLQQGLALVRRLLSDPDCQHRHRAALPGHRRGSFLHEPRGRRSFPGRSPRSAALPHLRTLRRRALPRNAPGPPSLGIFARRASRLLGWWARGLDRPTPFFDDRTKAPRAVPRVLTPSERAAL
jgi:hypothetical protein